MIAKALLVAAATLAMTASAVARTPATRITHGEYSDLSFSPDGKRMVAVALREGREQLAIMNFDGGDERALPTTSFDREDPAWSPDGRLIAYVSKENNGEVIHVMRPDGSNDVALTPSSRRAIHPSWSPDSRAVLYCTDDDLSPPKKNDSEIYAVDLAGRRGRAIITGGVNTFPNLSPDGRRIVFRKMVGETNSEVWVANRDGSGQRNLTNDPAFDGWPEWSPDGRRITFASNRAGNHKIYTMNRDGSDVQLVADTEGRGTAPKWTKDGARIFFTICKRGALGASCDIYSGAAPQPSRRRLDRVVEEPPR